MSGVAGRHDGREEDPAQTAVGADLTARVLAALAAARQTVAVAESLTAGAVLAELTRPAGASASVLGGFVVYATELKHTLLGVDEGLLEREGPVHPEVARQLAEGVRHTLVVAGRHPDFALATTGVAGPASQGGRPPGTVYLGIARAGHVRAVELSLTGDRGEIRERTVACAVRELAREVGLPL
ncbi:MAG TPA: CinA family protein [Microbacteriaceae bacterium]|nr:CinA family protein [Microbacteriaceae bacterium]